MSRHPAGDHRYRRGHRPLGLLGVYAELITDLIDLGRAEMLLDCLQERHVILAGCQFAGGRRIHSETPPWYEQVPLRCALREYEPSLHRAVAPAGAMSCDTVVESAGSHSATPPCREHAPLWLAAVVYEPSVQRAVAPAG